MPSSTDAGDLRDLTLEQGTNMLQDYVGLPGPEDTPDAEMDRIVLLDPFCPPVGNCVPALCDLAVRGLKRMAMSDLRFPHTMRSVDNRDGSGTRAEGDNLRYTINVAQGLAWTPDAVQRTVLKGATARDVALDCIGRAAQSREPGAVALAAWAAAETAGVFAPQLFEILRDVLRNDPSVETVSCAWALTAALAARHLGDTHEVLQLAYRRLLDGQSASGLFPHVTPTKALGWGRSHVGCFADQVYPIQALARLGFADGDKVALRASEACAARIVHLQGTSGQWWWHYDTRDGSVVEGYPVYSVHQHAMAPMALLDLQEAGGTDHRGALVKGLGWLDSRPETKEAMISVDDGVIWRKVGRNEPPKLVRRIAAVTTALKTGWHLPGLDALMPAGKVDRECRPYEFGWMLYAWRARGVVQHLRENRPV
ncbi:hypothetical protein [Devosia sp. 2618]|uniref:hypothetical protein n=1 Tax=Devosia sp. 2618 TaxID=3156454 RepID=UPI0033951081